MQCRTSVGRFLKLCIQLHRQQGLGPKKSTALMQNYHCLYGVRWSSGSKPLQNHHAHALPFDEQAASQVFFMLLPGILERIRSNVQLRPESTDALESLFEVFPDPPFHIAGVAMTRDLVGAYLEKEAEIGQATGFSDESRLFPLVQSYVARHVPDVYRQLYYVAGKCMEISLGGRTKIKDNEDVEVMTEHFQNHVIMNPMDAEAWHCLGVAFHTHADNLMWTTRDMLGKQQDIVQLNRAALLAREMPGEARLRPGQDRDLLRNGRASLSRAPIAARPGAQSGCPGEAALICCQAVLAGSSIGKGRHPADATAAAAPYAHPFEQASIVERAIGVVFPTDAQAELAEQETQLAALVHQPTASPKHAMAARITAALMLLKAKDRRRWHHKPIYQGSRIHPKLTPIARRRPGSHFVYLQKYATFLVSLYEHGGQLSQLVSLGRRLRKSTGVFLEPQRLFGATVQACMKVVRRVWPLPAAPSFQPPADMTADTLRQLAARIAAAVQIGQTPELMARHAHLQQLEQMYRLAIGHIAEQAIAEELRLLVAQCFLDLANHLPASYDVLSMSGPDGTHAAERKCVSLEELVETALQLYHPLQSPSK
ncbi:hypothetical protein SYNPS1DRAFT_30902, partial [Syncephalis pseudoplumigaleata]